MKKILIHLILLVILSSLLPFNVFAVGTNYRYTGQELDSTGLYYYGQRYYDPNVGRFTQPDPLQNYLTDPQKLNQRTGKDLEQILSNPQRLNPYSYTVNNPVKYVDPTGETPVPPVDVVLDPMFISDSYDNMQDKQTTWSQIKFGVDSALLIVPFFPMITTIEKIGEAGVSSAKSAGKLLKSVGERLGKIIGKIFQKNINKAVVESLNINNLPNILEKSLKPIYDPALAGTQEVLKEGAWQINVIYRETLGADQSLSRIVKYRNLEENLTKVYHEVIDTAGQIIHRDLK